jgi:hypothetical protein
MSFVLLALIWKEFPLWLYPPLRAGCAWGVALHPLDRHAGPRS